MRDHSANLWTPHPAKRENQAWVAPDRSAHPRSASSWRNVGKIMIIPPVHPLPASCVVCVVQAHDHGLLIVGGVVTVLAVALAGLFVWLDHRYRHQP